MEGIEFLKEVGMYDAFVSYAVGTLAVTLFGVVALTLVGFIHR